jgi:hypothetical protein
MGAGDSGDSMGAGDSGDNMGAGSTGVIGCGNPWHRAAVADTETRIADQTKMRVFMARDYTNFPLATKGQFAPPQGRAC